MVMGLATALVLVFGGSGQAGPMTFTFASLSDGASNTQVQNYMNTVLASQSGSVLVTGAVASTSYNGDGHVVGPVNFPSVSSYTLYTKDGTPFIMNNNLNGNGASMITMTFSGMKIGGISFDYEVFPDATGQTPDISLAAGNNATPPVIWTQNGTQPASPGYTHSPASGWFSNETSLQGMGSYSNSNLGGVTVLQFQDWPAEIGITNLVLTPSVTNNVTPVPEPASLVLLTSGIGGLFLVRRRLMSSKPRTANAASMA
jgi:hypothetical protein